MFTKIVSLLSPSRIQTVQSYIISDRLLLGLHFGEFWVVLLYAFGMNHISAAFYHIFHFGQLQPGLPYNYISMNGKWRQCYSFLRIIQSNLHLPGLQGKGKIARYIEGHGTKNYDLHLLGERISPDKWGGTVNEGAANRCLTVLPSCKYSYRNDNQWIWWQFRE